VFFTTKGDLKMKSTKLFTALAVLLAVVVLADSGYAQTSKRVGTAAATQLLIPVGARDLAMGGASIANSKGVEAVYWNVAGLGRMHSSAEGMFSNMSYIADIGVNNGTVGGRFGDFGVIALSITTLDFGDIPLTSQDDPENFSGRFYSPNFVTVGLSFARSLTDAISAGITAKIISEQIDRVSASGFALDIGVQYNRLIGIQGLELGVVVKNIGPQMAYDGPGLYKLARSSEGQRPEQRFKSEAASYELPSTVEIGLGYTGNVQNNIEYALSGAFTNNNLYLDEYKVGAELGFGFDALMLYGRAGMGFIPQAENDENIFGNTFGAGLHYNASGIEITVDYAYRTVDLFDANNVFSVKLGF
jgi:hypothetical protein